MPAFANGPGPPNTRLPDIQPNDWVFAQVDNGATAQVQIGDIQGTVDPDTDSISGTIQAPWNGVPVSVECFDWGSGNNPPYANRDGGIILPDGSAPYSCSWSGEWDVPPEQDIGIGYFGPDGQWVANAFRVITINPAGYQGAEFWVSPSDTILLRWGWGACTQEQLADFLGALEESYLLDGKSLQGQWTGPEEAPALSEYCGGEGHNGWVTLWEHPLGSLPIGSYVIDAFVSLTVPITDGIDSDGDGQPDFYVGTLYDVEIPVHVQYP